MPLDGARPFSLTGGRVVLGNHVVLEDVDFRLERGEFVVLLGANGSGKSTLIRSLLHLIPLAAGRLEIFGMPVAQWRDWARIGYVPQRYTAATGTPATVMEVVLSGRIGRTRPFRPYGAADRAAAVRALEVTGLTDLAREPVTALSGGQEQRVLIARALAGEPDVLVLDEPVSAVDLASQETFAGTLRSLMSEGKSVLLVAHSLGVMEPLSTRSVVLARGRVVYDGPPLEQQVATGHVHHHPHEPHSGAAR
ncbi:MAG: ATP-binding cassette domain-containing protein [Actinomycetota bacterium]|nr:ATP-binding cassette domain-containing protein [Actinomycetota bacterium]